MVDAGANNLRFYKVYEHLLTPFVESVEEFKQKIKMSTDLNMSEKMAITTRVQLRHDFDNPDPYDPLFLNHHELKETDQLEKMMNLNNNINKACRQEHVQEKELQGINFGQESISQIIKKQADLNTIMNRVHRKFNEVYT